MNIPPQWQTPEAQQALNDALSRAVHRFLAEGGQCGCGTVKINPETLNLPRHGLPHGAEFERVVTLARQGDKLAIAETRAALQRSRAQHEPVVRGIEWEPSPMRGRPPRTRMHEFVARFLYDEIQAGSTYEAAVERAAGMFPTAYTKRGSADVMRVLTIDRAQKIVRRLLARKDPA